MNLILSLIVSIFILMIFFRIYHINKPISLFGVIQKDKKAILARIISCILMILIIYGLIFHYLWGFILFIIDYLIGLSHNIIIIKSKKSYDYGILMEGIFKSNKRLIPYLPILGFILWTLIAIYLYDLFILH